MMDSLPPSDAPRTVHGLHTPTPRSPSPCAGALRAPSRSHAARHAICVGNGRQQSLLARWLLSDNRRESGSCGGAGVSKTVLIVDDERLLVRTLSTVLRE